MPTMSGQNENKLNRLAALLPEGLIADASWLEAHGYYRSLRAKYVSSGWLEQPTRGVFRRPRGQLSWEQIVISLQTLLEYPVTIGGLTALELQGYAHYLSQSQKNIYLYSDEKLPGWLQKLPLGQHFIIRNRQRFLPSQPLNYSLSLTSEHTETKVAEGNYQITPWGQWRWPLMISTPERAYLELLDELPQFETFHMADVMMEGLTTISPRRMQHLLEQTKSIKIKRLFFFFADRHQHQWLTRISRDAIDLGSGKRMLAKNGKFDPVYQITVPKDFTMEAPNGF